jgi:hypothetical protein
MAVLRSSERTELVRLPKQGLDVGSYPMVDRRTFTLLSTLEKGTDGIDTALSAEEAPQPWRPKLWRLTHPLQSLIQNGQWHLGGRLKDAHSALPNAHGCWKSMQEFVGARHHSVESQISLEAIELSKKSRVVEAL